MPVLALIKRHGCVYAQDRFETHSFAPVRTAAPERCARACRLAPKTRFFELHAARHMLLRFTMLAARRGWRRRSC
eukprot:3749812-Pleurochrysis_carterae.AAC.1